MRRRSLEFVMVVSLAMIQWTHAASLTLTNQNWQSDPLPALGGDNVLYGHAFSPRGNPMGGKIGSSNNLGETISPLTGGGFYRTDFRFSTNVLWRSDSIFFSQPRYMNNNFTAGGDLLAPYDGNNVVVTRVSDGLLTNENTSANGVDKSAAEVNGWRFFASGSGVQQYDALASLPVTPSVVLADGSIDSICSDSTNGFLFTNGGGTGATTRKSVTKWSVNPADGSLTEVWTVNEPSLSRIRGMAWSDTYQGIYLVDGGGVGIHYANSNGISARLIDLSANPDPVAFPSWNAGLQESVLQLTADGQHFLLCARGQDGATANGLFAVYAMTGATNVVTGTPDVYETADMNNGGGSPYALGISANSTTFFWGAQNDDVYALPYDVYEAGIFEVDATNGAILQTYNSGANGGRAVAIVSNYVYWGGDDAQGVYRIADDGNWSDDTAILTATDYIPSVATAVPESVTTDGVYLYTNDDDNRNVINRWAILPDGGLTNTGVQVNFGEARVRGISYHNGWVFTSTMQDGLGHMWAWNPTTSVTTNLGVAPPNSSIGNRDMNITTAGSINGRHFLMAADLENLYLWDLDMSGAVPVISNLETNSALDLAVAYAGIAGGGSLGSIWIDDANDQIILGGGGDSAAMTAIGVVVTPTSSSLIEEVLPASGVWTGGFQVVISGVDLSNGDSNDVTSVFLADHPATVDQVNGTTQIVVTAGMASLPGTGDVRVTSFALGETVLSNGFEYTKTPQVISFAPLGDHAVSNEVGLVATATSDLPVAFVVTNGPAVITGSTNLSFTGGGSVTLLVSQSGDDFWFAAPVITNVFNVYGISNFVAKVSQAGITNLPPQLAVTFYAGAGYSYKVMGSTNLMDALGWYPVPGFTNILGTNGMEDLLLPIQKENEYYRISGDALP